LNRGNKTEEKTAKHGNDQSKKKGRLVYSHFMPAGYEPREVFGYGAGESLYSPHRKQQTQSAKGSEEIVRLRGENDRLVKQSADLNGSVADLTFKLDTTEKERRLLAEQLTQIKGENQRLGMIIKGAQLTPGQQQMAVNRSGLPSINGVVRDVRTIAGNQYATISVGAADAVTRGMEFKVIDRATGSFLGTLVVDTVEPNESTGRLTGPHVSSIKPGVEVRTQL